jgi:hypothetical protein
MDAATLFMILTFPTGDVDTATREYNSLTECESEAKRYKALGSPAPNISSDAYCVKHLKVSSVVMPRFPAAAPGSKSPIEFCYQKLGIIERPSTAEAFVKTMDSPEFRKCMTWAPKDTDAHVPIPSAMELLERIPPERR